MNSWFTHHGRIHRASLDSIDVARSTDMRSANLQYVSRREKARYAYKTTNNKPAHAVFKIRYGVLQAIYKG